MGMIPGTAKPEEHQIGSITELRRVGRHGPGTNLNGTKRSRQVEIAEIDRGAERFGNVTHNTDGFEGRIRQTCDEYAAGSSEQHGGVFDRSGIAIDVDRLGGFRAVADHGFGTT